MHRHGNASPVRTNLRNRAPAEAGTTPLRPMRPVEISTPLRERIRSLHFSLGTEQADVHPRLLHPERELCASGRANGLIRRSVDSGLLCPVRRASPEAPTCRPACWTLTASRPVVTEIHIAGESLSQRAASSCACPRGAARLRPFRRHAPPEAGAGSQPLRIHGCAVSGAWGRGSDADRRAPGRGLCAVCGSREGWWPEMNGTFSGWRMDSIDTFPSSNGPHGGPDAATRRRSIARWWPGETGVRRRCGRWRRSRRGRRSAAPQPGRSSAPVGVRRSGAQRSRSSRRIRPDRP